MSEATKTKFKEVLKMRKARAKVLEDVREENRKLKKALQGCIAAEQVQIISDERDELRKEVERLTKDRNTLDTLCTQRFDELSELRATVAAQAAKLGETK